LTQKKQYASRKGSQGKQGDSGTLPRPGGGSKKDRGERASGEQGSKNVKSSRKTHPNLRTGKNIGRNVKG